MMALLMRHGLIGLRIIPETSNSRLFTLQNSDTMMKNKWQLFKSMLKVIGLGIIHLFALILIFPFVIMALIGMSAGWIAEKGIEPWLSFFDRKIDEIKTQLNYK